MSRYLHLPVTGPDARSTGADVERATYPVEHFLFLLYPKYKKMAEHAKPKIIGQHVAWYPSRPIRQQSILACSNTGRGWSALVLVFPSGRLGIRVSGARPWITMAIPHCMPLIFHLYPG